MLFADPVVDEQFCTRGELTYAVITSGIPGSRTQVYQILCQFLIEGMRSLGVELSYGSTKRGYIHNPNCFGTATAADLVLPDGTKLIGSAQLKRGKAILQHGSIRICPDAVLFEQVFDTPLARSPFWAKISDLLSVESIMDALTAAACEQFEMNFIVQPLSALEWNQILAQS